MNNFTIKDLENLSGVKAHTLRIWEQRYTFLKPKRTGTNIRYYSGEELRRILNIALLNRYGYKISRIDMMSEQEINDRVLSLNSEGSERDRTINQMINAMIALAMDEFEKLVDDYTRMKGIGKSIPGLIFPFLERIGVLWQTGQINPAQEHFVSNIIRQKLISGIEGITKKPATSRAALLFLPEGEYHELGLLFIYYLLKKKGIPVLYLGASIPMTDVEFVVRLKKPSIAYIHFTSLPLNFNIQRFLSEVSTTMKNGEVILSGHPVWGIKRKPSNVTIAHSLSEMMELIDLH